MNTLITGGSQGIGKALAFKFASEGHNLALCARTYSDLEEVKSDILKQCPNVKVFIKSVDITDQNALKSFANEVKIDFKHIDVLINNGGVFYPGAILEEEDGKLSAMIETNLYSAYHLTREIAPEMVNRKSGHIFNICSIASKIAYPNGGSYSISKFAMLGFSKVLREELKTKGVKVTSVLPGATWSASWSGVDLPRERLIEAEDIANSVWSAYSLGGSACVEEIVIRPQLGDL